MTGYSVLGAIAKSIFIPCGLSTTKVATDFCAVWLEAPEAYRSFFHNKPGNEGLLGFMGAVGLVIYIVYLAYFILIRLGKQGRSALEQ